MPPRSLYPPASGLRLLERFGDAAPALACVADDRRPAGGGLEAAVGDALAAAHELRLPAAHDLQQPHRRAEDERAAGGVGDGVRQVAAAERSAAATADAASSTHTEG